MSRTCILISSCDKYRPLADWTKSRIERMWGGHPPIFFSGLSEPHTESHLPFTGDDRDWMSVTLQAVDALIHRGFVWMYLILDDLPPVGECDGTYLSEVLPKQAERLDATLISLLGWGQHRAPIGPLVEVEGSQMENIPFNDRWRYSLHPGLWRLDRLHEILTVRMEQFETSGHTPWNFERHRESDLQDLTRVCLENCYRVHGRSHVNEKLPWLADLVQAAGCFVFDVLLFLVRVTRGPTARQEAAARWYWPYCYYRGPYPIFWSGVMRQGKVSGEWTKFLKFFNPSNIAHEWEKVRSSF